MHRSFERLHLHLSRHPMGFPKTASRHELEILKRVFTREEAEIALSLNLRLQSVGQLSEKTGIEKEELAKLLANMADKGAILEHKHKGEEPRYALVSFVPGIYEFQVQRMDEQVARAFEEIYPDLAKEIAGSSTPWMRVLPAEQSISSMEVVPYQKASELISQVETVAITDCICRKEQKLVGRGCDRPRDSICMYFNLWAEFVIDKGIGQRAAVADALKVLERGENAGLVHTGLNVMEQMGGMCQCCPCCCGVLRSVTEFKLARGVAKSDFYSTVDIDLCNGCESCLAACPVSAISMDDEKAVVNTAECIGCGVCVVECPTGATSLVAKKQEDIVPPPRNWTEALLAIGKEKGKTYFFTK